MHKFGFPFLYAFGTSIILISFLLWIGGKYNFSKVVRRFGGLVVILVFGLFVLIDKNLIITKPIMGILVGGLLILIFGLWDDLKNISWKWQLLFQIIIALVAISFGVRSGYITNPLGGIILLTSPVIYTILYTLYYILFINALNWLDGIDGLSGSVTLVTLGIISFLSLLPHVNQPAVAILCAIAGGTILGFLVFNWHPAKIIAGTAGAWFFGFLLASLSIFAGAKVATVLMVALIPILDLVRVVYERYQAGQSVFLRDSRHLQFKLLKLGLGEAQIAFMIASASILIGMIALNVSAAGKLAFMIFFSVSYFWIIRVIGD